MTTEEILLTVLTIAVVVLITLVLVVLFMILRIMKKMNNFVDEIQTTVHNGSQIVQSLAPVSMLTSALRLIKIMKRRGK